MQLFLASQSPRRLEILVGLGLEVRTARSSFEEVIPPFHPDPEALARELALAKMEGVAPFQGDGLVVTADTLVFLEGVILGKPSDEADARRMLELLSGQEHSVVTAICLRKPAGGRSITVSALTQVVFDELEPPLLESYLAAGEWTDKAGAYGIQGLASVFTRGIQGCYFNVVGFPVNLFRKTLQQFGYDLGTFRARSEE